MTMGIGLKRGIVRLEEHQTEWEDNARQTIAQIKRLLGDTAVDVQHVGSTAIRSIPAKPIIDIAVGVRDYDAVLLKKELLEENGIIFRFDERPAQLLFVKGDFEKDTRTHHIHVVRYGSKEWNDYLLLRDHLNADEAAAQRYADLKRESAQKYPDDRNAYTDSKSSLIAALLAQASAAD